MKILHILLTETPLPPLRYGGTERVMWALSLGQQALGHEARFLVRANPAGHPAAQVFDAARPLEAQIEGWADVLHFHWPYDNARGLVRTPYVCTEHANRSSRQPYPINTIFLSQKHARIHGAQCHVYNGLHWPDYGEPNLNAPPPAARYAHYLAKAANRNKNLQGAVRIARRAALPLHVMGGRRWSLKSNFYFYAGRDVRFHGMAGGEHKLELIRRSSALLFPVLWHEPFGLAIIESLYLGCPVIATPYGSLPELVSEETGFLSDSESALAQALADAGRFDRRACHESVKRRFNHLAMARAYQQCYERVLAGEALNPAPPVAQGLEPVPRRLRA